LFRRNKPSSFATNLKMYDAGWHHSGEGSHEEMFVTGVGAAGQPDQPLLLDPTVGLIAPATYTDVRAGTIVITGLMDSFRHTRSSIATPSNGFTPLRPSSPWFYLDTVTRSWTADGHTADGAMYVAG